MDSKFSYKSAKLWRGGKRVYDNDRRNFTTYIGATGISAIATCV